MQSDISHIINKYLQLHKISDGIIDIIPGSIATSYLFKPFVGMSVCDIFAKLSYIKTLLKNPYINSYCKIGTDLIAIDIPNTNRPTIFINEIIKNIDTKDNKLPIILGLTQDDVPVIYDLYRMEHMHVMGDKGSGKTTFLSCIIYSLLTQTNQLTHKISIIDIKNNDLAVWKKKINVINEISDASKYLDDLVKEMHRRQKNKYNKETTRLITIIDNLDQINDSEHSENIILNIKELIEYGHRVGVHLIITTKSDTLDFGYIPTRLTFHSNQQNDMCALDKEEITPKTLLLYGQALFCDSGKMPIIVYTPYISESAISLL